MQKSIWFHPGFMRKPEHYRNFMQKIGVHTGKTILATPNRCLKWPIPGHSYDINRYLRNSPIIICHSAGAKVVTKALKDTGATGAQIFFVDPVVSPRLITSMEGKGHIITCFFAARSKSNKRCAARPHFANLAVRNKVSIINLPDDSSHFDLEWGNRTWLPRLLKEAPKSEKYFQIISRTIIESVKHLDYTNL
jgi:hypothetical protein